MAHVFPIFPCLHVIVYQWGRQITDRIYNELQAIIEGNYIPVKT